MALGFAARYATEEVGPPLDPLISDSMNYLMTNQLLDKNLSEMMEKYSTPSNCKNLMVPKVNSPIWDSLQPRTRSIDLKLQKVQKSLIKGTTAFSTGLSDPKDNEPDSLTCLANANFELNMLRRELIKPELNPRFSPSM